MDFETAAIKGAENKNELPPIVFLDDEPTSTSPEEQQKLAADAMHDKADSETKAAEIINRLRNDGRVENPALSEAERQGLWLANNNNQAGKPPEDPGYTELLRQANAPKKSWLKRIFH